MNFHVTYLFVFETKGDKSKQTKRFNFVRDKFKERFGRFISEKVILHQLNTYKIDWNNGVTEPERATFLLSCKFFMLSMLGHPKHGGEVNSELFFTKDEQEIVDYLISQNNSR